MPPKTRTLHLLHSSQRFSLTQDQYRSDIQRHLNQEPDILTTTESVNFVHTFRSVARENGYRPVEIKNKACMIAVRTKEHGVHVKDAGSVLVVPGQARLHAAIAINWVKIMYHGLRVYHHVAHWVAPHDPNYLRDHPKITRAMITQVRKHAKKNNLAFFAGDINEDDDPGGRPRGTGWNQMLREAGLKTIWDEHRVYPPTMGGGSRTIDVIGKYINDNAKGKRYKIYPKMNADHRALSAWYEIDMVKEQNNQGGNNNGGGGNNGGNQPDAPNDGDHSGDPKDDDFYATGGNVSWDDYLDDTIYDLPQATDDSDTTNG